MNIFFAQSSGVHEREITGIEKLKNNLPKDWYAFANLELVLRNHICRQIDIAIVLDDRIMLVDIKDWHGKISSDGLSWFCNGKEIEKSPVAKIIENSKLVASVLKEHLYRHKRPSESFVSYPLIDGCVVLTGKCSFDLENDNHLDKVFYIDDFCKIIQNKVLRKQRFQEPAWIDRLNPLTKNDSTWRQKLHSFFVGGKNDFRPQQKKYGGYLATSEIIYKHYDGLYSEYECEELSIEKSAGLLRIWDFTKAPAKFAAYDYRKDIAGREQNVISHLLDCNPNLETKVLRPRSFDDQFPINYWEVFEKRKSLKRLVELKNSDINEWTKNEKYNVILSFLSVLADLHQVNMAHLDIGEHSLWIELPANVRFSHFFCAHYNENRSLAEDRYDFLGNKFRFPEDIFELASDYFRRDVYLAGLIAHIVLFGSSPPSDRNSPPEWKVEIDLNNNFQELHNWLEKSLQYDPAHRFKNALEMLGDFNDNTRNNNTSDSIHSRLEHFQKWKSLFDLTIDFKFNESIKNDNDKIIYISEYDKMKVIVKAWKVHGENNLLLQLTAAVDLLDRAELLYIQEIQGANKVIDFGYADGYLVVISEYVDGIILSDFLKTESVNLSTLLPFYRELLETIEKIHSLGFGHGDLSPSNILVCKGDGPEITPTIIDVIELNEKIKNPLYSPNHPCTPLERDRYGLIKILEEMLIASNAPDEVMATIQPGIDICLNVEPSLATVAPLKDAVDKILNPSKSVELPEIVINLVGIVSSVDMLSDSGVYYVSLRKGKYGDNRLSITGINQELVVFFDNYRTPIRSNLNPITQSSLEKIARYAELKVRGHISLLQSQMFNANDFDFIFSTDEISCKIQEIFKPQDQNIQASIKLECNSNREDEVVFPNISSKPLPKIGTYSIKTETIWKALKENESNISTEVVTECDSEYSVEIKRHIVSYQVLNGVLDFDENDIIEVKVKSRSNNWIFLGRLDVRRTDRKFLAIDNSRTLLKKKSVICSAGSILRFDSLFEIDSRNRRERATERILNRASIIPDLIDYFECDSLPSVNTYKDTLDPVYLSQTYSLNESQIQSFINLWKNGPVGLLQGPPGTGKTRFIAAYIHYALTKGGLRNVLLSSQSHEAVNNTSEFVIDLFRKNGELPSLIRVGQEGQTSEKLRPHHSVQIESLYRERFKSRLYENYKVAGRRLYLPQEFIESYSVAAIVLLPMLRHYSSLHLAEMPIVVERNEFENRLKSLRQTIENILHSIAVSISNWHIDLDPEQLFKDIIFQLAERFNITNHESLKRLNSIKAIVEDWMGHVNNRNRNFEEFLVNTRQIVCGTCVGIGRSSLGISDAIFDLVVVDEAARCTPGELAVPLQSAKRILLVGDHLQLEPFFNQQILEKTVNDLGLCEDAVLASDFQRAFNSNYGKMYGQTLATQYRMLEPIGKLVSKSFYEPTVKLSHGRDRQILPAELLSDFMLKPLEWYDTSDLGEVAFQSRDKSEPSTFVNYKECDIIMDLLAKIDANSSLIEWFRGNYDTYGLPIGVICAYSGQKKLLIRKIASSDFSLNLKELIKVDTIDSYQGSQNLIVIVSLVRNNRDGSNGTISQGFMSRGNRINVGLSRAMDRLIVVGSRKRWPENGPLFKICKTVYELEAEGLATISTC